MKIKEVKVQVIERDIEVSGGAQFTQGGISFLDKWIEVPILRIITDEGIEGNSCGFSGKELAPHIISLKPFLLGEDPLFREELWQKLWEQSRILFIPPTVLSMIDVALWDIGGKVANLPIYQLLGAYREKVRAYASSPKFSSVEVYVEQVLQYKARGFTACKLHVPCIPSKDLEICRAVREAVGDDMLLMLDPVGAYDREQALMVGRELEKLNFYWYEEPISDFDIDGLTQLCRDLDIPIATLEALPGNLYTRAQYIARGAVDMVRSDVMYNGGITPLKKIASLAEAFGIKCEIHANTNPLMSAANLHVTCSIRNCDFYECIMAEEITEFGVKQGIKIDNEGYAHVPKGPGLGMEVDWEYIDGHTIATL